MIQQVAKLNLGCGPDYRPGYWNVDADPNVKADEHADILTYEPKVSYPVVYMKHVAEHLPIAEIPGFFARVYSWLVPGGTFVIDGPNLQAMCRRVALKEPWNWDDVKMLLGGQETDFDYHRSGWSPSFLTQLLKEAGFREVRITDCDLCMIAEGVK